MCGGMENFGTGPDVKGTICAALLSRSLSSLVCVLRSICSFLLLTHTFLSPHPILSRWSHRAALRAPLASLTPSSKTSVHHYDGSNVDLGTAAGRLYRVGVMSIQDAGDSDLVSATVSASIACANATSSRSRPSKSRLVPCSAVHALYSYRPWDVA